MTKKNLPIKLFQKRRIDERQTEGSGSSTPLKWVLTGDELEERAEILLEPFSDIEREFATRPSYRDFIPVTLKVDIDDNAIAKSHRKDVRKLFDGRSSINNIIGFVDSNSAIVKVDSLEESKQIQRNIRNFNRNAKSVSAIESIEIFRPYLVAPKEDEALKISLIDFLNYELNNSVKMAFIKFCQELNIGVKEAFYSSGLIIYRAEKIDEATLDKLSVFEALESITFMPKYKVGLDTLVTASTLEIKKPDPKRNYPVVGVLDTGIAKNSYLDTWLEDDNFSSYPKEFIDPMHGTCVSSIILYSDQLENEGATGNTGVKLFDATVFPDKDIETICEDELVENIIEAIKSNNRIKIWNLSLGTEIDADINQFSDFGIALDNIQESYDVMICKSAGNCKNFKNGRLKGRIAKSADSIRSLVVGSVAQSKNEHDISEFMHPSPFTRVGPGPANIIKPELVTIGGNAGVNGSVVVTNGVQAIDPASNIVKMQGTSFATPRVTALLSELNFRINEDFNPTLLKALAIHSAKYPSELSIPVNEKINQMGFGIPTSADDIIYNDPYEITLILQENIVQGKFIEILEFPFPESLVDEEGFFYGDVKVTLVAQPVLREKQGAEYCQSNLDVKFGTYENIKDRDITKPNILNEIGPDDAQNVLRDSNYRIAYKKDTSSEYARERMLLNYGKKYQPVKKYSVNLNEMTPSNKEHKLRKERKWYAKIIGTYRDFAEALAQQDGEILNQDFTLIVTIRDNKRQHKIYNEVTQLLENRNFLHSNIKLREEIRIDVSNKS